MPVRSGMQDMSITPKSVSMCSIWLGGLLLNIPGAAVHTSKWDGFPLAVSSPGCNPGITYILISLCTDLQAQYLFLEALLS